MAGDEEGKVYLIQLTLPLKLIKKLEFPSDIFVLCLFGIYSLTLAPRLAQFLAFGEPNYFVAFFGFLIYILEVFAFRYKLYVIRLRAEEMRIHIRETTGSERILPRAGAIAWIGFFTRAAFRVGILIISIKALGVSVDGRDSNSSGFAFFLFIVLIAADFFVALYLMFSSNLFNPDYLSKYEAKQEIAEGDVWANQELKKIDNTHIETKELLADIVLQVYSFMLYTGWWDYINRYGIKMTTIDFEDHKSAWSAGVNLFGMLFFMTLIALPSLRLSFWIEKYAMAFTDNEKWRVRGIFILMALVTIGPSLQCYYELYFQR